MNVDQKEYDLQLAKARTKQQQSSPNPFATFGKWDPNKHPRLRGKFTVKHGSGLVGSPSRKVTAVQSRLHQLGYSLGKFGKKGNGVDGRFGNFTERAVKSFQKDAGIRTDGIVGRQTLNALSRHELRKRSRR